MAPKNIMHEFSIAEISGVDEPAQAPALMTLMKAKGESHIVGKSDAGQKKEGPMPKTVEELEAELAKSAKTIADAAAQDAVTKSRLAFFEAYMKMSPAEKAAADEMDEEDKAKFVAAPKEEREEAVAKRGDKNPVIYKSKATGAEYRKSDDPRLVDMAKRDDEREAELTKMREQAIDDSFVKKAGTELVKFKGTVDHKAALLKAVAGIKDDDVRKGVSEMLKAAHGAMGLVLKEVGTANDDHTGDDGEDLKKSSENQLDAMAKALMKTDPKLTFAKAYDQVLQSDAGAALYAKASA